MAWVAAATWLGAQIGPALARSVVDLLKRSSKADQRLERLNALVTTGTTAVAAFHKVFGQEFDQAVAEALKTSQVTWTYEAGRSDYIRVDVLDGEVKYIRHALRDELNINLDRIARMTGSASSDGLNYFLGVFREWMARYRSLIGADPDAEMTFATIESLLDGKRKSFSDAFRLLQQTGLGTVGALLVLQAVLVATSTGVGVAAAISTWLLGVPMVQVGVLAVGGVLILALSRIKFRPANGMSVSIAAAYKLLERGEAVA